MLQLPNGCSCSEPTIHPHDWRQTKASLNKKWYVQYYFRDPNFVKEYPSGKYVIVKGLVNQLCTLQKRREGIQILYDEVIRQLTIEGYNPILGKAVAPSRTESDITQDTPFISALKAVKKNVVAGKYTLRDLEDVIKGVEKSAVKLRLDTLPISMVSRKHIKLILSDCGTSGHKFNKFRTYLIILFNELLDMEATDQDPLSKIKKRKTLKRVRLTLSAAERKKINDHLLNNHYTFWRFMHIFFHSGSRETEMMQVRFEDVNLKEQKFKIIVRKGKEWREEWRTVKDIVMPLWEEIMAEAKPGQYLFAKFLTPGDVAISSDQLAKRWRKYVKAPSPKGLNVKADFYSLKHTNLDEIAELLSIKDASDAAGHSTVKVTKDFYLVNEKEREHKRLKGLGNSFVPRQTEMVNIGASGILDLTGHPCTN